MAFNFFKVKKYFQYYPIFAKELKKKKLDGKKEIQYIYQWIINI